MCLNNETDFLYYTGTNENLLKIIINAMKNNYEYIFIFMTFATNVPRFWVQINGGHFFFNIISFL